MPQKAGGRTWDSAQEGGGFSTRPRPSAYLVLSRFSTWSEVPPTASLGLHLHQGRYKASLSPKTLPPSHSPIPLFSPCLPVL